MLHCSLVSMPRFTVAPPPRPHPLQVCSEGRVLGSLELLDSKPRTLNAGKEGPYGRHWPCCTSWSNRPPLIAAHVTFEVLSEPGLPLSFFALQARWTCCAA